METFTITYKQNVTKEIVLQSLVKRLDTASDITSNIRSCCGSLAYLSLFMLPGYELEDKKVYSIENVCTHVPGIFTLFMHDVLENLGQVACGKELKESLKSLLDCAGFYECFQMLGVVPKDWYRVFLYVYYDENIPFDQLQSLQTYDALVTLFQSKEGLVLCQS